MITPVCQRWRERRDLYRPKGEVMDPREYEVSALPTAEAKMFVISHHYSGTFPAARRSFALHRRGQLVGVAVFSHPASNAVLTKVLAKRADQGRHSADPVRDHVLTALS